MSIRSAGELVGRIGTLSDGQLNQDGLIGTNLGPDAMGVLQFHGVSLCFYAWPALATELLALRDRGIVCFV